MIGTIEWDDPIQLPKHQGWRAVSDGLILSVFGNKFNLDSLVLSHQRYRRGYIDNNNEFC